MRNDENGYLSIEKKVSYQTNIPIAAPSIISRFIVMWLNLLNNIQHCEFSESMIWKPYCKKLCIVSAGNSWKRMTRLDKGKMAGWS